MSKLPVDREIAGFKFTTTPLPFERSEELLPTVGEFLATAMKDIMPMLASGELQAKLKGKETLKDLINDPKVLEQLAPTLMSVSQFMGGGRLKAIAPKILHTTTVVMPDLRGEKSVWDLGKEPDRNYVFGEHPECYIAAVLFAGQVTFKRFFPGFGQAAGATPAA